MSSVLSATTELPKSVVESRRFLTVLVGILSLEIAFAAMIRARAAVDYVTGARAMDWSLALSLLGLLLLPGMAYSVIRVKRAQGDIASLIDNQERSSERLRTILDTAAEGIYAIDSDGRCTMANPAAGQMLGYLPSEMIGRNIHDLIHHSRSDGSPYPVDECPIYRVLRGGESCKVEDELLWRKDGSSFRASYSSNPKPSGVGGAVVTFRDITARVRLEEELRAAERRMLRLMEDLPMAVFVTDSAGRPIYSNRTSKELLGLDADPSVEAEDLTEAYQAFVAGTHVPYPTEALPLVHALAGKATTVDDMEIRHPDGRVIPLQVWGTPIKSPEGEIEYALAAFMDITERKRSEKSIKESEEAMRAASNVAQRGREEAEAANRAKSDFLSRMSHELRTPLNGILGFAQLLEMDDLSPDNRDSVEQIRKAGSHLLDLINEVLDLARIEAGRLSASVEAVSLRDLVEECVTLIRPLAVERDLAVTVDQQGLGTDGYVLADRQRLKQVLLNLLSNAVKYNRRGGEIRITSTRTGERVEIEVADTGLGIPAEKIHRLFTAFDRLDVTDEEEQGTGLGLALSKRLAEIMGGDLRAASSAGEGSSFTIDLQSAIAPHEQAFILPSNGSADQIADAKSTVLYIEDNVANVKLIERIFKRRPQVSLETVMQGQLGLDLAREIVPDLVLLDMNLPDMNGDEVMLRLRQDPATSDIPVVLLSADATHRQITRMLEAGAVAYITKPIDVAQLLSTVDEVLGRGGTHVAAI